MASLKLEHIYKVYPNGTKAVNDISLDINNGEFIVFVGPSGCGKSTTLRMIAGLEEISAGELYIDSAIVNDVEPKDRDIAMVFQNYALYPHMTVYENMAFGLKLRHVPDDVIQEKVLWASEILGIKEYLDRKPRNMSGGQRQRVALGRAILRDPKVMLLDEPLSNLDAKLRTQMRTEIAKLHQKLKTTFIYVTHDQTEAMTLGDRVVVMRNGRIQQVDTPKALYDHPANKFVAGFIGTPQMNFFNVTLTRNEDKVSIQFKDSDTTMNVDYNRLIKVLPDYLDGKHSITLGIRCESLHLASEESENSIEVKVSHFEELGSEALIYGSILKDEENLDSTKGQIIIKVNQIDSLKPGDVIHVSFDMDKTYFFDDETEETIVPRIPAYNSFDAQVEVNNLLFDGAVIRLPKVLETPTLSSAELRVPCDAILLNKDGFPCKVNDVEVIKNQKLLHLDLGKRIFFALTSLDDETKVGDIVNVSFDFARISLINKENGALMFKPLDMYDTFHASFFNYASVIDKNPDPAIVAFRDSKIKAANDYMNAKILLENQEYEKRKLEIDSMDVSISASKAKAEYETISQQNEVAIKNIRKETSQKLADLKAEYKKNQADKKKENEDLFRAKKQKEEEEYRSFMRAGHDHESIKRRKDEYHLFKDHYHLDKENSLNRILNTLALDYESKVATLSSSSRRENDLLRKATKDAKNALKKAENPSFYLEKEHKENLSNLNKEKQNAVNRAGFVFFLKFLEDYYCLASDIISNKLIQGLGTRVFNKQFRIEVPHDAYQISNDGKGIKVKVDNNFDYGNVFFVRCSYVDENSESQFLYLLSDKPYDIGSNLVLSIDVTRSKITEPDMNIRLY